MKIDELNELLSTDDFLSRLPAIIEVETTESRRAAYSISDENAYRIANAIEKGTINSLSLINCGLSNKALSLIMTAACKSQHLISLNLAKNPTYEEYEEEAYFDPMFFSIDRETPMLKPLDTLYSASKIIKQEVLLIILNLIKHNTPLSKLNLDGVMESGFRYGGGSMSDSTASVLNILPNIIRHNNHLQQLTVEEYLKFNREKVDWYLQRNLHAAKEVLPEELPALSGLWTALFTARKDVQFDGQTELSVILTESHQDVCKIANSRK